MAKLNDKIRQQLKRRDKRRRQGRVAAPPASLVKLTATAAERDRFTTTNGPDLLAIEGAIVDHCYQEQLSDREVKLALSAIIRSQPASSASVDQLMFAIERARQDHDCPADMWHTGLRVIYRSLTTTSKCQPGETSYLDRTREFLARARG